MKINTNTTSRSLHNKFFWAFVLPALLCYFIFYFFPLLISGWYSLTDFNGLNNNYDYVGINNYIRVFSDKGFLTSLFVTFLILIMYVLATNILSVFLAMLLDNQKLCGRNVYRGVLLMPNTISLFVTAFLWQFMFTKVFGSMMDFVGLGEFAINWFRSATTARVAVVIAEVWHSLGYYTIVYIAGLQSIDRSYIDAASVDGAVGLKRFWYIILPLLMPSVVVCLFLTISNGFKSFDIPFLMTGGGPFNATKVIGLNIYREIYTNNKLGYASAKAIILCIIIFIFTYFQLKAMKSKEVEG